MLPATRLLLLSAFLTFASIGCSVEQATEDEGEVSAEEALKTNVRAGSFKLYAEPNTRPNPSCDVHTKLTLANKNGAKATLTEALLGFCEIHVEPNERTYKLRLSKTTCGSKVYKGRKKVNGKWRSLTVTDHRTRTCLDLQPALVVVDEKEGATTWTKYSSDAGGDDPTDPVDPVDPIPGSGAWLSLAAKQCNGNFWYGANPAPGQEPSPFAGEAGEVDDFLTKEGIAIEIVGFVQPANPFAVCAACSCPRGDTLVVKTKDKASTDRLTGDYGFTLVKNALVTSPKQCNSNPWSDASTTVINERDHLVSWASSVGAPLKSAGFLYRTEPMIVCQACSCPRGDTAIAFPETKGGEDTLEGLGFTPTN